MRRQKEGARSWDYRNLFRENSAWQSKSIEDGKIKHRVNFAPPFLLHLEILATLGNNFASAKRVGHILLQAMQFH